jgi:hypothetical protein
MRSPRNRRRSPSQGKIDHDLPGESLAGGWGPEPFRLVGARHVGLLADTLRADHDLRQVECDVRKRSQKPVVEARRSLVTLPAVSRLDELVDAIVRERREEAGQIAVLLRERMAFPELPDLVVLVDRRLSPEEREDAVAGHRAQP